MPSKDQLWTQEEIDNIPNVAAKYTELSEFQEKEERVVRKARRLGIYKEITKGMTRQKPERTKAAVKRRAKSCKTSGEFGRKYPLDYQKAARKNWLAEFFPDSYTPTPLTKERVSWNIDKLAEEAKKYKTRTEFKKGNWYAYVRSGELGVRDEICAHMPMSNASRQQKQKQEIEAAEAAKKANS